MLFFKFEHKHYSIYTVQNRYACFRFLSLNTVVAYQRAKISSLNIVNSDSENSGTAHVTTISHTISVDLTKSDMATI